MKLKNSIQLYVDEQRTNGIAFTKGDQILASFCRHVGNVVLDEIRPRQVLTFLEGPRTSALTWSRKYSLLRNFFLFWVAQRELRSLPLPAPRKPVTRTFVPHIYSREEIQLLLATARSSQSYKGCSIDAATLRTMLVFFYATGVLVGEGRRLLREDVDLKRKLVTIRDTQKQPSRQIPIGTDLAERLLAYRKSHHRRGRFKDPHFFLTVDGCAIKETNLQHTFQKLRRRAGVCRRDGISELPRLHDLRYTFAVHRLAAWHRHGADVNRMLPALSVYMGYTKLGGAARYLRSVPERFYSQLNRLSPRRAKKHWRDDPALMQFLANL